MKFKLSFFKSYSPQIGTKRRNPLLFFIVVLLLLLLNTYLLYNPPKRIISDQGISIGDIVRDDIIIRNDATIEDKESTEENRARAIEALVPIYEYHEGIRTKSQDLINQWYSSMREYRKKYLKDKNQITPIIADLENNYGVTLNKSQIQVIMKSKIFQAAFINQLLEAINRIYDRRILTSKIGARKSQNNSIKIISKQGDPITLKIDEVYDLGDVENRIKTFLRRLAFSSKENNVLSQVLMAFMDVNISYSNVLTKEESDKISAQINPVMIQLKANKVILRKGDEVKAEHMKMLRLISSAEEVRKERISKFFVIFAILFFLFLFLERFFRTFESGGLNKKKLFLVLGSTITLCLIVYKVSLFLVPLIIKDSALGFTINIDHVYFAIPLGFGALIIAFIFDLQSAVIFSFINAILSGIISDWNIFIVIYALMGNLAVSFGIEYYQRVKRSPIFKASLLFLLPLNLVFILLFDMIEPDIRWETILIHMGMGAVSAIITPILASFIIPLWEVLFTVITDLKLIELTNLNLPIFREMLEKAPGTYHHSQMVASLSEATARELHLSPLLLTAMALYHDIGKIDNPQIFTENHSIYKDPHENLSPRESSKNIKSHISDGIEKSLKIKLPSLIAAAIPQHHGTKLVKFFYDKALEMSSIDTDEFDDKDFRYAGEKPKTIETAIIMLADQVEAASKSLASPSDEEIRNVIQQIININIEENQFDECEKLTFKSLNIIANSFHKKLSSIYHMRVSYPGFNFKSKEENGKNNR